jgi:hypothetical protein
LADTGHLPPHLLLRLTSCDGERSIPSPRVKCVAPVQGYRWQ